MAHHEDTRMGRQANQHGRVLSWRFLTGRSHHQDPLTRLVEKRMPDQRKFRFFAQLACWSSDQSLDLRLRRWKTSKELSRCFFEKLDSESDLRLQDLGIRSGSRFQKKESRKPAAEMSFAIVCNRKKTLNVSDWKQLVLFVYLGLLY